ncbi:MAG: carbohydrate binding domain-containing protein, partial [Armatimonadetes bacterium]|nr:carbohydrate binding domain-containing protein [Armatimonadota bacterium]
MAAGSPWSVVLVIPRRGALVIVLAFWVAGAQAYDVTTGEGLKLQLDSRGQVKAVSIGASRLPLTGPGGFFLADVAAIPAREVELCPNGGFEQLEGGAPVAWSVGADWALDDAVAHSGTRSMRVSIPGPEPQRSGSLSVDVAVKPNTPYRVSMWMRTEGGAPYFYIVQMDAAGADRRDYPQICVSHARTRSDWFQLMHSFVTAPFCRKLRVYTNLWEQTGEAWVDDVSVVSLEDDYVTPQKLLSGTPKATGAAAALKCTYNAPESNLRLTATYQGRADHILVDAELEDTSGRDRAVTVSFRLPIQAQGWTWFDDIHNAQRIEPGILYGAGRLHSDRRVISLYPFACLGNEKVALGLAAPMDWPRPFRLCYEAGKGFYVNYEFGLTREAAK